MTDIERANLIISLDDLRRKMRAERLDKTKSFQHLLLLRNEYSQFKIN
jgi:hypothetical protein